MRDGDIDYSKYTLLELEESLAGINKHKYPENYANLRTAYAQLTATLDRQPEITVAEIATDDSESYEQVRERFFNSRPVAGVLGAVCLWWAYDLFTQLDSCPSGKRLTGAIVKAVCENLGHPAAECIPLFLGLMSVAYAVLPRRRAGA
jgi:hypothetical protein